MKLLVTGLVLIACSIGCSKDPASLSSNSSAKGSASIHLIADTNSAFDSLARSAYILVHAEGMDTIRQSLIVSAHAVTGTIQNIPAGPNRIFDVFVLDAGKTVCYFGSGNAPINARTTVIVKLTIYRYDRGNAVIDGRIVDSLPTPQCFVLDTQVLGKIVQIRKVCNGDTVYIIDSMPTPPCFVLDSQITGSIIKLRKVCNGDTIIVYDSINLPGCITIDSTQLQYGIYRVVKSCDGRTVIDTIILPQLNFNIVLSPDTTFNYNSSDSITIGTTNWSNGGMKIVRVFFYADSSLLGADSISPFSIKALFTPGWHTVYAIANVTGGGSIRTNGAMFFVKRASNVPPSIAITSPKNGASFRTSENIVINANALDTDGTVQNVRFFKDTTYLGMDSIAPFSFTMSIQKSGAYRIFATATDNEGAQGTSAEVSITVR